MSHSRKVATLLLAVAFPIAATAPVVAQADGQPEDVIVPEGVRWELRAYDGPTDPIDVLPGTGADLVLESGRATFNAGCDLYFGEYVLDGDNITFGDAIQRTDRPCSDEAVELQNAYLPLLHGAVSWRPYFGAFQLLDASGEMLLEFSETTVDISQRDLDAIIVGLATLSDDVASLQARVRELEGEAAASGDGEGGSADGEGGSADGEGGSADGATGADPGGRQTATAPTAPLARVKVERRYTSQDRDQARGRLTWRDRSDDEDGFHVYARRIHCGLKSGADPSQALSEEDFTEKRSRFVRVASLPADATRYRPRHAAIMDRLPPEPLPRYGTGAAYDLYVAAYNEAGESDRVPIGSYTVTPEWFCP